MKLIPRAAASAAFLAAASAAFLAAALAATGATALDSAGEGRRLWLKYNCYGCHGMNGAGGMGPKIRGERPEIGDVTEKVILGSDEGMPAYGAYLDRTDVKNLTTYLGTLGTPREPTWTHWWEKVPSR